MNRFFVIILLSALFVLFSCGNKNEENQQQKSSQELIAKNNNKGNDMAESSSKFTIGDYDGNPQYIMTVTQKGETLGKIKIELFPDVAPKHVRNFDSLVHINFYDGTAFHRVIPGFMIQGGDPNSKDKPKRMWGMGDPSQTTVPAEFNDIKHERGIISAARSSDPNSATSQFFIMHANAPHLDGQYTAYGKVVEGLDVVDKIAESPRDGRDNPNDKIEMKIERIK